MGSTTGAMDALNPTRPHPLMSRSLDPSALERARAWELFRRWAHDQLGTASATAPRSESGAA
jgi:hypothetical protein